MQPPIYHDRMRQPDGERGVPGLPHEGGANAPREARRPKASKMRSLTSEMSESESRN